MTEFDFTKAHRDEAWLFLDTLWQGLEYLCGQVERAERERVAKSGKNFAYIDFVDQPGDAMLCNYFVWYASELYSFILVFQEAFSRSENLEGKLREVLRWRHDVAAHPVWLKNNRDVTKQSLSILLYPEFNFRFDGHFEVGGLCDDWRWGLVRAHERLREIVSKYASAK